MLPPRVLELVPESESTNDVPASSPTVFFAFGHHVQQELVAPTALPAPPLVPAEALMLPPSPRVPQLSLVEGEPQRSSERPTVRVGRGRGAKVVRLLRPSRPPPPSMPPPPPGSAPIRKAA